MKPLFSDLPTVQENLPRHKSTLGGITFDNNKHRKALVFSLWDGIFANTMGALVDTFAVAAAVHLNAPSIIIAMLSSIPLLLSSIGQFFLPYVFDPSKGRKKYVIFGTTTQSLSLLILGCSGWLPSPLHLWAFVLFFIMYGFTGNIISGLWITWMGDLVPSNVRGRHFAWRNRILSFVQLGCTLLTGLVMHKYSIDTASWLLFALVFFTACIFRWISTHILYFQYEPKVALKNKIRFTRSDFLTLRPFLFFCLTTGLMQGAAALSGPFFNVWYVRDLHFNFFSLSAASAATFLGTIISLPLWGKLCDTIGNRRVLYITGLLISLVPFPYIIFGYPWQICLLNLYSGFSWSGYNLSNFNYVLTGLGKSVQEKAVILSVAINGLMVFTFGIIGGILATRLPIIFHWQLSSLFFLSGTLRLIIFFSLFLRFPKFEAEKNFKISVLSFLLDYRSGINFLRNNFNIFKLGASRLFMGRRNT